MAADLVGTWLALYGALLADHVADGRVDYAALQDDPRLAEYLSHVAATDTSRPRGRGRIGQVPPIGRGAGTAKTPIRDDERPAESRGR